MEQTNHARDALHYSWGRSSTGEVLNGETLRNMRDLVDAPQLVPISGIVVSSGTPEIIGAFPNVNTESETPNTDPYAHLRALNLTNKNSPQAHLPALESDIQRYQNELGDAVNSMEKYVNNLKDAISNAKYFREKVSTLQKNRQELLNIPIPQTDYTADAMQVAGTAINGIASGLIGRNLLQYNDDGTIVYPFTLLEGVISGNDATISTVDVYTNTHTIYFRFKKSAVIEYGQGMQLAVPMNIQLALTISPKSINLSVDYDTMGAIPHPHVKGTGNICWGDIESLKNQMINLDTWIAEYVGAMSHVPHVTSYSQGITPSKKREDTLRKIADIYFDYGSSVSIVLHTYNASSPYFTYADSLVVLANTVNEIYERPFSSESIELLWYKFSLEITRTANSGSSQGAKDLWRMNPKGFAMVAWIHKSGSRYQSIEQALKYLDGETVKSFTSEMGSFIRDSGCVDEFGIEVMFDVNREYQECDCGYYDEDADNYNDYHEDNCASHDEDEDSTSYKFDSDGFNRVKLGLTRFKLLLDYLRGDAVYVEPVAIIDEYAQIEANEQNESANTEVEDENTLF